MGFLQWRGEGQDGKERHHEVTLPVLPVDMAAIRGRISELCFGLDRWVEAQRVGALSDLVLDDKMGRLR